MTTHGDGAFRNVFWTLPAYAKEPRSESMYITPSTRETGNFLMHRVHRITLALGTAMLFLLAGWPGARHVQAQERQCFTQTGQCIEGRFLEYWQQNGGLAVFGYPTGSAEQERSPDTGVMYLTQWFERNRFELHPENAAPYDVLLGRLGDGLLQAQGRQWQMEAPANGPKDGCLWFEQTGHNVCDQGPGRGFKSYWQSHGLKDERLDAYRQSLALFGLPLTEAVSETNRSGDTVITQWFERGRFEWHPDKPDAYKVLLGLLTNELWPKCSVPMQGGFGRLWTTNAQVRVLLGCPLTKEAPGAASEQIFEQGLMYWWSGTDEIHIGRGSRDGGTWDPAKNTYREGEKLAPLSPPPGLYAPQRGFGKLWRESGFHQAKLGWATGPEASFTGVYQRFERGIMLYSPAANGHAPRIYVLAKGSGLPNSDVFATYPDL